VTVLFNIVLLLQITKKWELALQKEIPQELHEVSCVGFCVLTYCTTCSFI